MSTERDPPLQYERIPVEELRPNALQLADAAERRNLQWRIDQPCNLSQSPQKNARQSSGSKDSASPSKRSVAASIARATARGKGKMYADYKDKLKAKWNKARSA